MHHGIAHAAVHNLPARRVTVLLESIFCALATSRPSGRSGAASLSVETRQHSAALPFLVNLRARHATRRSSRHPRGPLRGPKPPKRPVLPPSRTRRVAHHPARRASLCEKALRSCRKCLHGRTRLLCARPVRKLSPSTSQWGGAAHSHTGAAKTGALRPKSQSGGLRYSPP